MIGDRHEELLHKHLDGETTPEEDAEVREMLAADPEFRTRFEELGSLFRVLASAGEVEPPEGMHARIDRALAPGPTASPPESWRASLAGMLHRRPWPAFASAFAAGLLAGVAIMAALQPRSSLDDAAVGTLLPGRHLPGSRLVDERSLDLGRGRATVLVRSTAAGLLWVEMDVPLDGDWEIDIAFDPRALGLVGFETGRPGGAVRSEDGRVHMRHTSRNEYRLFFSPREDRGAPMVFRVEGMGVRAEARLRTSLRAAESS